MSGGRVRRAALARVAGLRSSHALQAALFAAIELCDEGFLQFVYEAGYDAGLADRDIERRGVPLALQYAAIQLCDDLSDGDCDYLDAPARTGPLVLMLLQNLFLDSSLAAGTTRDAMKRATHLFAIVGSGQHDELTAARWTRDRSHRLAASLTGHQLAAYLELLWDGTELAPLAFKVGVDMGTLAHITTDIVTNDPRYWSLSTSARASLRASATQAARRLSRRSLASVDRAVNQMQHALRKAKMPA